MWGGKLRFATPMLFSIAFLFQFLIAGLTGIMLACAPWDWQLNDSYFLIAHFHYTLVGAIVFMIFAAIYYWFPKATGRLLSERLGKWHFWLFLIGFHMTFDTMHIPGILGMPRRIYTYEAGRGWGIVEPHLHDRRGVPGRRHAPLRIEHSAVAAQRRAGWKRSVGCLDSGMDHQFAAAGIQFRRNSHGQEPPAALGHQAPDRPRLEIRMTERTAMNAATATFSLEPDAGWTPSKGVVGMTCLIIAESAIFTIFVVAYLFYLGKDLSGPTPRQVLELPILNSICLLSSSATITFAVRSLRNGDTKRFSFWWLVTIALGAYFLLGTGREWHHLIHDKGLTIQTNLFGTTFYSLVGLHASHVVIGLLGTARLSWLSRSPARSNRNTPNASMSWRSIGISWTWFGSSYSPSFTSSDADQEKSA